MRAFAPRLAAPTAMAAPRPVPPPVTRITFPSNSPMHLSPSKVVDRLGLAPSRYACITSLPRRRPRLLHQSGPKSLPNSLAQLTGPTHWPSRWSSRWSSRIVGQAMPAARLGSSSRTQVSQLAPRIGNDPGVVERQLQRRPTLHPFGSRGVVASLRHCAQNARQKRHGARVAARVAAWIGVDADELEPTRLDPGLLLELAPAGVLDGLADVHEAAG